MKRGFPFVSNNQGSKRSAVVFDREQTYLKTNQLNATSMLTNTDLVCGGKYFRKGYYDIDVDVDIYSTAYNDVKASGRGVDGAHVDISVDVDTSIYNETHEKGDISMRLASESNDKHYRYDPHVDVYKYNCEECGFIMSFTMKKDVESKFEEKKRKEQENAYDWTNFKE